MKSYTVTSAAAAGALLASLASASHPAAMSVNTSDFKAVYEDTGIVPEVVAGGIDPQCSFYFGYMEEDGDKALLMPGHTISLFEAQQLPFEWSVENLSNVTGATTNSRYLIYIADVDAPDRSDPTARNLRHYLGGNFTVDGRSELLDTAQRLVNSTAAFSDFVNPNPALGTGVHRFLSALYVQPDTFDTVGFESAMDRTRANWDLGQWRQDLGLGPAIAATVWMVNTTDAGTLNAAPSVSFSTLTMLGSIAASIVGAFSLL